MSEQFRYEEDSEAKKSLKKEILEEMKEFAYEKAPEAQEDWDLIWVLSGPQVDIKRESTKEVRNESRERLETGFKVAREVTAKRTGKDIKDLTIEDILQNSPGVYYNGTDEGNDILRQIIEEGILEERYGFPKEKIMVSPNLKIKHTGHQFESFPEEFVSESRKIVLVTDIYHLPRTKRYFDEKYNKTLEEKMNQGGIVIYPSEPRKVPVGSALREIKKIPVYIDEKILPIEKKQKK